MATVSWADRRDACTEYAGSAPSVEYLTPLDCPAINAAICSCYTRRRLPLTRGQDLQANAKPTAALGDGAPGSEDPTLKLPKVSMLQLRLHLVERTCLAVHDHVQAATCRVGCRGL